jgi:pimeloyl-ACP methyl ester carboxylesterase
MRSTGTDFPLIWVHEFAGGMESWLPQVNFFSRRYRVIVYNARGYPPSAVPADASKYGQDYAAEDLYGRSSLSTGRSIRV